MAGAGAVALGAIGAGSVDLPSISPGLVLWLLTWFILGFAFYSTAYGAPGALASRSEDAQGTTALLTAVLVGSYFFVFITVTGEGPE